MAPGFATVGNGPFPANELSNYPPGKAELYKTVSRSKQLGVADAAPENHGGVITQLVYMRLTIQQGILRPSVTRRSRLGPSHSRMRITISPLPRFCRICQTSAASPAEPGGLPVY